MLSIGGITRSTLLRTKPKHRLIGWNISKGEDNLLLTLDPKSSFYSLELDPLSIGKLAGGQILSQLSLLFYPVPLGVPNCEVDIPSQNKWRGPLNNWETSNSSLS